MNDPAEILPGELRGLLVEGAPLALIDVREPDERAYCAIEVPRGVVDLPIPLGSLPARLDEVRAALEGGRTAVIYCHHGVRSLQAVAWLSSQGIGPAASLAGGIDAWSAVVDQGVPRY